MQDTDSCPFCFPDPNIEIHCDDQALCLWDAYPVNPGHGLVATRRHVASWFLATPAEQAALVAGIDIVRGAILATHQPDGFNIGVDVNEAAGQTVPHLHVHVIPRYLGDVIDPRGGVRNVVPARGNYLKGLVVAEGIEAMEDVGPSLVGGDRDPLGRHLLADLAQAEQVDIAVAFILETGISRIQPYLEDVLARPGARVRILTGDYLTVTEPRALYRLLDLSQPLLTRGQLALRVFETDKSVGFHPKAYLIRGARGQKVAYVGSSNLSRQALERGVEWNYRISAARDAGGFQAVQGEFDRLFQHKKTVPLTPQWVRDYQARYQRHSTQLHQPREVATESPAPPPLPHSVQSEALQALARARADGHHAGLVIMATGLGKTWLSAFDSTEYERILFVAHREEILDQARHTFRRIRPDSATGFYTGEKKVRDAEIIFASIQTLGRQHHLELFSPDAFDYIVVDEFHHASAPTYRRLINYFEPKFLLGLTATPDRTDGGDLMSLCGQNLVYRCDLDDGIRREMLAPFHYFGVPDAIEYQNIPWRNGRFDPEALDAAVATQARAENAFQQWSTRAGKRTLAFCVSQRHADYMVDYFLGRNVRAAAVHSGPNSAPRAQTLEQLSAGDVQVVFAVDMFNEGVDIPNIDTVLMLRPTESKILWLQQLGRGLRTCEGKDSLTVVDYIGNHQTFLKVPTLLFPGVEDNPAAIELALQKYSANELELPPGCSVTYDLEAVDILRGLIRIPKSAEAVSAWYRAFRDRNGQRPTASEAWTAGYDPVAVRRSHGGWFSFVASMGDLEADEKLVIAHTNNFLEALETAPTTSADKVLLLLGLLAKDQLPGQAHIAALTNAFAHQARRSPKLSREIGVPLDNISRLQNHIETSPIAALTRGMGAAGVTYFTYEREVFATAPALEINDRDTLRRLTQELCDWRLVQYLDRGPEDFEDLEEKKALTKNAASEIPQLWSEYMRAQIPTLWGLVFSSSRWNKGFVTEANHIFLLVNLDKRGMQESHQYEDVFLNPALFQ